MSEEAILDERAAWLESVIGQTEEAVRDVVVQGGGKFRVRSRDGEQYFGTADLNMNRLNVHIENGVIVKATFG